MTAQTFNLKEIAILSFANEIIMRGKITKNNLSYESQISINSHQLNKVINELQKQNPEDDISGSFRTETDGYGNVIYFLNVTELSENSIDLDRFVIWSESMQIRA
jgi:hypothetical protein